MPSVHDASIRKAGRPRNAWSPSRERRLVRLLGHTGLTIAEIKSMLATSGFTPSRSDIQKKLRELLPHDYGKDFRQFRPRDDSQMRNRFNILQFDTHKGTVRRRKGRDQTQTEVYEAEGANITAFRNSAKSTVAAERAQASRAVKNPRVMLDGSLASEAIDVDLVARTTGAARSASSAGAGECKGSDGLSAGSIERRLEKRYSPEHIGHIQAVLEYSSPSSVGSSISPRRIGSSISSPVQHSGLALRPRQPADHFHHRHISESSRRLSKGEQRVWDELFIESMFSPSPSPSEELSSPSRLEQSSRHILLARDCDGRTIPHGLFESTLDAMYTASVVGCLLYLTGVDIHAVDSRGKSLLVMLDARAEACSDHLLREFLQSRARSSSYSSGIPVVTPPVVAPASRTRKALFGEMRFDRYRLLVTSNRTSKLSSKLEKLAMWNNEKLDIDWVDADGDTLLLALIRNWNDGDSESELTQGIERLMAARFSRGASGVEVRDKHGNTPLAIAAARGYRAVVKILLRERANVHSRNHGGVGILKQILVAKNLARRGGDGKLHSRICSRLNLLADSGAKHCPSSVDEWMTPQGKARLSSRIESPSEES